MSDVLGFESRDTPFPVALAAMIGIAKAAMEVLFGVLGVATANSVDDSFSTGLLVFGIVYTVALATLGLVVAVAYLFRSEAGVVGATLIVAFFNALVLYLLLGTKSGRGFFGLGAGASP
jgi:hypothetical protein